MCAVTHRAKPALLIKQSLYDIIGTLHSVCEAIVQYINFSLICALFGASSINTFKEIYILHNICDTWWERDKSRANPGFARGWAGGGSNCGNYKQGANHACDTFPLFLKC